MFKWSRAQIHNVRNRCWIFEKRILREVSNPWKFNFDSMVENQISWKTSIIFRREMNHNHLLLMTQIPFISVYWMIYALADDDPPVVQFDTKTPPVLAKRQEPINK